MHATTISAMRTRAWFRLGAVGAVLGLAIGAMTVIPAKVAGAATGNTYYVNSATDTPFTTLADLSGPALDCTSPTNTGCGIDDAIEFFNSDTTSNNADTVVFSASVSTFTVGQHTAINNFTSGITLAIDGNGATQTAVSGNHNVGVFEVTFGVTVNISGLTIENGNSFGGGGIFNNGGTVTVTASTISGNTAGAGGGIFNPHGTVNLTDSTISGNADPGGGGGGIVNGGTVNVGASTISGNTCGGNGGGIFNQSGTVNLTDSTISGNTCGENGGGIANGGTVNVGASIVAGNTGGIAPNCAGSPLTSVGYNLTNDTAGTQCGFTNATDVVNADPLLGTLGINGGPTQTQLPGTGSPAIGVIPPGTTLNTVSVCPRVDQRGVASAAGAKCTIGAVEVAASPCAAGLTAHVLTATYHTGTFSGLFCVNAKGVGTYSQGAVSGFGAVIRVKATTIIGALGKNLFLLGATNGTTSSFGELAPVPSHGTFTLS